MYKMYNDYMQNLLMEDYSPCQYTYDSMSRSTYYEKLYPEIYKIVYPMIKKALGQNTRPITEDYLNEITNDLYNNIESENIINLNIDITNNRNENKSIRNSKNIIPDNKENRYINNSVRDLIKILLIRELADTSNYDNQPKPLDYMSFYPKSPMLEHHPNIPRARY